MGKFDFLKQLGESKDQYEVVNVGKDVEEKLQFLEILVNRNLMDNNFKEELLSLYINKKISDKIFGENIQNSISIAEKIEFRIISIDDELFKNKNDEFEYIGAIDRILNDKKGQISSNKGKVSYSFVNQLFVHLKDKVLTVKEINSLSDALDFDVFKVLNIEQIKAR